MRDLNTRIEVIPSNIIAGLFGFKQSRANFEDLLYIHRDIVGTASSEELAPGVGTSIGLGTQIASIQTLWTQGSPMETASKTDMAIQGDGLFRVKIFDDVADV